MYTNVAGRIEPKRTRKRGNLIFHLSSFPRTRPLSKHLVTHPVEIFERNNGSNGTIERVTLSFITKSDL